jgi:hypothetical protein
MEQQVQAGGVKEKQLTLAYSVLKTAGSLVELVKKLPITGKVKRNVFIKSYNRRPMNKQKRRLVLSQMAFSAFMGAIDIASIQSKPIPKFKAGGIL